MTQGKKPKKRAPPLPARGTPPPGNRRVKNRPVRPAHNGPIVIERSADESRWPATAVELVPIESLSPYIGNAHQHPDSQIEKPGASIGEWGFTIPVLTDETGEIIAGHARLIAAQRMNLPRVPRMIARDWTLAQRRAYVIADNQLARLGTWDSEMLVGDLRELQASDYALGLLGFSDSDMRQFFATARPVRCSPIRSATREPLPAADRIRDREELHVQYDAFLERGWRVKIMT